MYHGFAGLYDGLMEDVDYRAWTKYVLLLLQEQGIHPEKGPLVLECACGTGSVTVGLKQAGCNVVASDVSPDMLLAAQKKARALGLSIPFVEQDMRALSAHRKADAVVCCCDGVNYLQTLGDVNAFFASAAAALKPGGVLLFDVSTPYKLETVLGQNTFGEDNPRCTYLWRNNYDPQSRLLEMDLSFFLPDGAGKYDRFDETHIQRAHGEREIRELLIKNGFCGIRVYDAFTANPPSADSERNQWTARKWQA